ncbi:amino acid adenylation domain-containing protein [Nonomuraea sp. NPDC050556]|uniref:amino acid adenylation domain-containing protein n=1 Tax=Nonomuraea sp. NPDC050556 TaxID=3364369 RepID=UPI00379021E5
MTLSTEIADATTLADALATQAVTQPNHTAVTFLSDADAIDIDYASLDAQARAVGMAVARYADPGDRVVLLLPAGPDFVAAFFGVIYAGAVPVPLAARVNRSTAAVIGRIVRDSAASAVITSAAITVSPDVAAILADQDCGVVCVEEIPPAPDDWARHHGAGADLAFLQYTSGTTSAPKGVMVSHAHLLHNLRAIRSSFGFTEESRMVSWLPPHHDMGLIGTILTPVYLGVPTALMDPAAFIREPSRWLGAISRYRGTISGGPNFAYDLCAARTTDTDRAGLDLSSWTVAFNGAEPVRASTLRTFARAMRGTGFRPEAFLPCYGLAEGTLLAAGRAGTADQVVVGFDVDQLRDGIAEPPRSPLADLVELVGYAPVDGMEIRVTGPDGKALPDGLLGEIWLASDSVTGGYWNRPDATAATFGADGRFLRTGDLGFTHAGNLFVRGRIKDCVVVRGQNVHPEDVEATIREACTDIAGRIAVFGVDTSDGEALVAWYEVRGTPESTWTAAIAADARAAVADRHGVTLHEIVGVAPRTVLVTTSGKIRRTDCAAVHAAGTARIVAPDPRSSPVGSSFVDLAARVLRVPLATLDPVRSLTSYGLDSLRAAELQHLVESTTGVRVPLVELLADRGLSDLAGDLATLRSTPDDMPAVDDSGRFPLSAGQHAIWLQERYAESGGSLNLSRAIEITGLLDVDRLAKAVACLPARHPALRTQVVLTGGDPVQELVAVPPVTLDHSDAIGWSAAKLDSALAAEAADPFTEPPLLRTVLYRVAADRAVLQLTTHHGVMDVWSLTRLVESLAAAYRDKDLGEPPEVGPADFVAWQLAQRDRSDVRARAQTWAEKLSSAPALDLPTDHPRPALRRFRGRSYAFRLPADLTERVASLAGRAGVSVPVVLFAAYGAVLGRFAGQTDLTIGFVHSGRVRARFADLVSYLANPLPVRLDAGADTRVDAFLRAVSADVVAASDCADIPYRELAEAGAPALSAVFAYQHGRGTDEHGLAPLLMNHTGELAGWSDLRLHARPVPHEVCYFDLSLYAAVHQGELLATVDYDADLFDHETVAAVTDALSRLLASMCDNPDAPMSTRSPAGPTHDQATLVGPDLREVDTCIHRLFEDRVRTAPDAPAVLSEGAPMSYAELNRAANRLAHRLIALGIGPEDRVAILLPRSVASLVGVLGVLKSGAAYVPLDPAYPTERLRFMVADSGASVLVADLAAAASLPGPTVLDPNDPELAVEPDHDPVVAVHPDNLAYVVYTSGSTGTPHGVLGLHRGITNRQVDVLTRFPYAPGEVGSHKTSLCFFDSGGEMFLPLVSGAPLVVVPDDTGRDPVALVGLLARHGVTRLVAVPSLLRAILDSVPDAGRLLAALRYCHSSGEALPTDLADRWREALPGCTLVDLYGSSEVSADVTLGVVDAPCSAGRIGAPIGNMRVHVLDAAGRPLPRGFPGEIYVAGSGLARGYLNQPALTAARFTPDPYGPPGSLMFRTGDRGRVEADGTLRYLGRVDHQVKIRGFRIELGEVESVLSRHPAVAAVAVAVVGDEADTRRLVASVVPAAPGAGNADAARVEAWRGLYDRVYDEAGSDQQRQASVWTSSFTGRPFTAAEIGEWTDQAVARVRGWQPQHLLEIGCGTGNIALAVAPDCERYLGTDISKVALRLLAEWDPAVETRLAEATDFSGIAPRSFDTVVLNSVTQYFPSHQYLLEVLRGAVDAVTDGGRVYLGDVRSLELADAFYAAVEIAAGGDADPAILRDRAGRRRMEDEELVCSRRLFEALPATLPRVFRVEIHQKRGRTHNELTSYRNDIVLHVGQAPVGAFIPDDVEWTGLAALRERLRRDRDRPVLVRDVPNARLNGAVAAVRRLGVAVEAGAGPDADPEDLWLAAHAAGRRLDVTAAASGMAYAMDLRFWPVGDEVAEVAWPTNDASTDEPVANDPLWAAGRRALRGALHGHARAVLPDFMVPTIELIDRMPTTDTGKVDRGAVARRWAAQSVPAIAPRAGTVPLVTVVIDLWREVLGVDAVGVDDNFFDVGGNSLSLVRVHIVLQQHTGRTFPLVDLYEHTTIRKIVAFLSEAEPLAAGPGQPGTPGDRRDTSEAAKGRQLKRERMRGI